MVAVIKTPQLSRRLISAKSTAVAERPHVEQEIKPNFIDKAKIKAEMFGRDAKIFGNFLFASAEDSGANKFQKFLPLALIAVGLPALPALLCKNAVSTPNAKLPDDPFWSNIVNKLAYAFDPLFQAITVLNFIIAALGPSPGRMITYGLLALANHFIAAPNNKKSLDNGIALRAINTEVKTLVNELKIPNTSHERKELIISRLNELYEQESVINKDNKTVQSWIQFFGNGLFNIIMAFSFLAFIPTLSKSCRYTRFDRYNRDSPYNKEKWPIIFYQEQDIKKIIFGGAKNWDGTVLNEPYLKVFLSQLKREFVSWKMVVKEFGEFLEDPAKSQGTINGRNRRVEEGLELEGTNGLQAAIKEKENKLGRKLKTWERAGYLWTNRLSQGLFPAFTTALNATIRLSIFVSALTAFLTLGVEAFAPKSNAVNNPSNPSLNGLTAQQNFVGDTALGVTSGLTNIARGLSAGTSIVSSFNTNVLLTNGSFACGLLRSGGIFSGLAMLADKGFNQPGVGLTFQFISSLLLWLSTGVGNVNIGFSKYHKEELKKMNDIKPFARELNNVKPLARKTISV